MPKEERVPGRAVDAALVEANVTAAELASRLGVTPETVSRWRREEITLSRSRWVAVLAVLGLPLEWQPPKRGTTSTKRGRGRPRRAVPSRTPQKRRPQRR